MNLTQQIQHEIDDLEPEALVLGLGPSLYAAPGSVFRNYRLFGVNDIEMVMPVNDLIVIDHPNQRIDVGKPGFDVICETAAERLWMCRHAYVYWQPFLSEGTREKLILFSRLRRDDPRFLLDTFDDYLTSMVSSTTAAISCAWACGFRRIGVIGMDHLGNHSMARPRRIEQVGQWFEGAMRHARERGGEIRNLSPISALCRE